MVESDPLFSSLPISVDHERYHSLLPLPSDATHPAYRQHSTAHSPSTEHSIVSAHLTAHALSHERCTFHRSHGCCPSLLSVLTLASPALSALSVPHLVVQGPSSPHCHTIALISATPLVNLPLGMPLTPASLLPCCCVQVTGVLDGRCYVLRRVHGYRPSVERQREALEGWIDMQRQASPSRSSVGTADWAKEVGAKRDEMEGHPALVALRRSFVSADFGDGGSLCCVYDYCPAAVTLEQRHLLPSMDASTPPSTYPSPLSESLLWAYTTQLVSALHAVHSAGLALHDALSVRRVLVVSPYRIRVNGAGMRDMLLTPQDHAAAAHGHIRQHQQEDLYHLGHVLLTLASVAAPSTAYPSHLPVELDPSLELNLPSHLRPLFRLVASRYSQELAHVIAYLLTTSRLPVEHSSAPTVYSLTPMIAHHTLQQHTAALSHIDAVEESLAQELQNGRLFRTLTQLNWITDRPQSAPLTLSTTCKTHLPCGLIFQPSACVLAVCWVIVSGVGRVIATCCLCSATWCSTRPARGRMRRWCRWWTSHSWWSS